MSCWQAIHHAPRDRAIWVFLPGRHVTYHTEGRKVGHPKEVRHDVTVARWSPEHSYWLDADNNRVFPSLWHITAEIRGPAPEHPVLS
jgi:hypothetical protein